MPLKSSERIFTWSQTDTRKYDILDTLKFAVGDDGILLQSRSALNGKKIYMHVVEELGGNLVVEMPLAEKVKSVKVFKDGTPLKYTAKNGVLSVTIPETPTDIDYVIVVEKK